MILLLLALLLPVTSYDFAADLKRIKKEYYCDPECTFNKSELTLETIAFFPEKCTYTCGIITLNEKLDLSVAQLKKAFKKMQKLSGGIRIENTNLTSLSFLSNSSYFTISCELIGISIVNNSKLSDADVLYELYQWPECPFQVENNSQLDVGTLCESRFYEAKVGMQVYGNKRDCGCKGEQVNEKCTAIFGGLILTNSSQLPALANVVNITGNFEVHHSNYQNLSFLSNLRVVKSKAEFRSRTMIMNIHDNSQMTRLGLSALTLLINVDSDVFPVNLENLHPDFCLTTSEMALFLRMNVKFQNVHAHYCAEEASVASVPRTCKFEKMSSLEENCKWVLGDVLIDSGDENYVEKLTKVTHIFGTLVIRSTQLESLACLTSLKFVASLSGDSRPAIQILYNKRLENATMPNFKKTLTQGSSNVLIKDNAPKLFEKTLDCLQLQAALRTNLTFNDSNCKNFNKTVNDTSSSSLSTLFLVSFILIDA
ncbi:unnamed protein product [Caenorhabditis sp. 36 PRJEB53466]|nr:unnamed protein product [Caenorhabditis sp. 36 PRJEB53466]